jgi:hypothetical protein
MVCLRSRRSAISSILSRALAALQGTAGLLALAALLSVSSAQATALRFANADPRPSLAADRVSGVQDSWKDPWIHDLQVIADLKASPSAEPVVCLLGGSSARECTISDEAWAAQVQELGESALTYNLGSSDRTFAQDVALMEALPRGQLNMIVFIGMSAPGMARAEASVSITLPAPTFPLPPWSQHYAVVDTTLPVLQKLAQVSSWMADGYPALQANYGTARMMLERLIVGCKARGLHPVLVDLPQDTAIIGHAMDAPISRCGSTCRALSVKYSIPYLGGLADAANLANGDFYDLWHIHASGRVKWQRLLSEKTAELLQLYGLGSAR